MRGKKRTILQILKIKLGIFIWKRVKYIHINITRYGETGLLTDYDQNPFI